MPRSLRPDRTASLVHLHFNYYLVAWSQASMALYCAFSQELISRAPSCVLSDPTMHARTSPLWHVINLKSFLYRDGGAEKDVRCPNHLLFFLLFLSLLERIRVSQTAASSLDGRHFHNPLAGLLSLFYQLQQGSCKEFHRITSPVPFVRTVGVYPPSGRGVLSQNPLLWKHFVL